MNKREYQQYLKSIHWQTLRFKLKMEDWYQSCFICEYDENGYMRQYEEYTRKAEEFGYDGNYVKEEEFEELAREYKMYADEQQKVVLHHCNYKNLGSEKNGDLIPLCEDCHANLHFFCKIHKEHINYKSENTTVKTERKISGGFFGVEKKERNFTFYPDGFSFRDLHVVMKNDKNVRNWCC